MSSPVRVAELPAQVIAAASCEARLQDSKALTLNPEP